MFLPSFDQPYPVWAAGLARDSSVAKRSHRVASDKDDGRKKEGKISVQLRLPSLSPMLGFPNWIGCCDGKDCQHYVNEKESESASHADNSYVDNLP